jgi:hypothetical protein
MTRHPRLSTSLTPVPVLVEVVTRAGGRCECTRRGCHGRSVRCEQALPGIRLIAAPRDPAVPGYAAWRVPAGELAAWCNRCHQNTQTNTDEIDTDEMDRDVA